MSVINDVTVDRFIADACSRLGRVERWLDLGCGTQPYARHYRPVANEVVAADYEARSSISVRLSAMALPFRDAAFDAVLFSEVLEHLDRPEDAMREIARVTRDGGHLLLTVPFNYMQHEAPHDHVRYTQFGLLALLDRHGFRVQRLYQRGSMLTLTVALVEMMVRLTGHALGRLPLLGALVRPVNDLTLALWTRVVRACWSRLPARNVVDAQANDAAIRQGHNLRGGRGQLRLWSLGYCVWAIKKGEP